MTQRVPVLVLVDDGYFGHETLQEELGPSCEVRFAAGPIEAHTTLGAEGPFAGRWPVVLAPRTLEPLPGDVVLAELDRHRYDFVGLLILDEDVDRLGDGVHGIVRRPLKPGALRTHVLAAAATRERFMRERGDGARLWEDLGRLRDGLRHDLRGQLQSVVGLASLVLELEAPKRAPDDEFIDFMNRIAASGTRLTHFVDALGDWLNCARRPVERAVVDVGELVAEVVAKARSAAEHQGTPRDIGMQPPDPSALGATVSADPRMLQKAIETLVDKALQASQRAHVRVERAPDGWRVAVSDVCPKALPASQLTRAFSLFERVAGGDGIGLALVAKVAERHQARVELAPLPTGGHEVVLTWPWTAA